MIDNIADIDLKKQIIDYYNHCWLNRFEHGHNAHSLAMHLGHFGNKDMTNDAAKNNANQFLLDFLGLNKESQSNILDVGCGVGGTCFYIASNYLNANVTGVNLSASQIDFAKRINKKRKLQSRVSFFVEDFQKMGLKSEQFDFIYGVESICHAENKRSVFNECYRLLNRNGTFAIMDYFEVGNLNSDEELQWLTDFREGWVVNHYIKNHKQNLEEIGFKDITECSILNEVYTGIERSYMKAVAALNSDIDHQNASFVKHLKACIALKHLADNQLIDYKIVKATKY